MTTNKTLIIKAMECCIKETSDCGNCPLYVPADADCINILKAGALDLINRQKAEIGRLEAQNGVYETCNARKDEAIHHLEAEIERLEKLYKLAVAEREANVKGFTEALETAKAETIKDITGYLESEIEDSDKRISEFDTSDEERGYNKGLRVALSYVQEFAEGV